MSDPATLEPNAESAQSRAKQLGLLALAVVLSILVIYLANRYKDEIMALGSAGLLGLFLINIIGNATVIIPIPIAIASCAAAGVYNPVIIGLVAGTGATLGEVTGFLAGSGGKALIPQGKLYKRLEYYVQNHGMLTLFLLALIPNPLFDVGGAIAGILRMPLWKFLLSATLGKSIRLGITAWICLNGKAWFGN